MASYAEIHNLILMQIINKIICNFMQNWFVSVAIGTHKIRSIHTAHGVYFDGDFTQFLCRLASFCCFCFTKKNRDFHLLWPLTWEPHELKRSFFFLLDLTTVLNGIFQSGTAFDSVYVRTFFHVCLLGQRILFFFQQNRSFLCYLWIYTYNQHAIHAAERKMKKKKPFFLWTKQRLEKL